MRMAIVAGLMVAGLVAGCGGTEAQEAEQGTLATREDALPACHGQSYHRIFYAEPEMITEVGEWMCSCSSSTAYRWGRTTSYSTYLYNNVCPGSDL